MRSPNSTYIQVTNSWCIETLRNLIHIVPNEKDVICATNNFHMVRESNFFTSLHFKLQLAIIQLKVWA